MVMKLIDRIKSKKNIKNILSSQGKSKFKDSVNHAMDGINYTREHERNFRIELFMMGLVLMAGIYFNISSIEWLILLLTIALVLTLEMINTSIERCVDLVTKEYHELAKNAKDVAAGAVFIMSIFSVCIGIVIFLPKIIELFR